MSLCWTNTSAWPDSQTAASFLKRSGGIVRSEWPRPRLRINCQISLRFAVVNFVKCPSISHVIREVKHHVCVKWQTQICTTWSSFLFTCGLLFIISTKKLVVSRDFLSIRIALSGFFPAHFLFWEIPNLNLTFAVYVMLKLSILQSNPSAEKMKRILCFHWLPERSRQACRARLGFPALVPHARERFRFGCIINPSLTMPIRSNICLVQFCDFIELDLVSVHKNAEKNLANIQRSWSHAPVMVWPLAAMTGFG